MKFALLSVTYSGLFYAGEPLSLQQQVRKARELGFDALSIETKRPIASPIDLDQAERAQIKETAAGEGITLCALESLSNFASPIMEERENNLAMMKEVLRLASDLDIRLVKVFAAWPGVINDDEEIARYAPYEHGKRYRRLYPADLRKWNRAVEGIQLVADWASDLGITIALQNHAPVIRPGYEDALEMMEEIGRDNVKLCLDVPLFQERQSDEYIREAVDRCADAIVLTHYGAWNFSATDSGEVFQEVSPSFGGPINYKAYLRELHRIEYQGYLVSEYCLPCVKNHRFAGEEEIDRGNRWALSYMKDLLREIQSSVRDGSHPSDTERRLRDGTLTHTGYSAG